MSPLNLMDSQQANCLQPYSDNGDNTANFTDTMQVRAAFGLFDPEGKGWVAGDRLQAHLVDASFRYG